MLAGPGGVGARNENSPSASGRFIPSTRRAARTAAAATIPPNTERTTHWVVNVTVTRPPPTSTVSLTSSAIRRSVLYWCTHF